MGLQSLQLGERSCRHTYSMTSYKINACKTMQVGVLIMLIVYLGHIQCSVGKESLCLLDGQVFYVKSGECLNLLERGPCDRGHHLTVGEDGTGVCKKVLFCDTGIGEMEVLDLRAGTICDCAHGMVRIEGKCKTLFSSASCSLGDILLPQKFALEENMETCPESFTCIKDAECEVYLSAKQEFEENEGKMGEKLLNHLKSLICNKTRKKICCPNEKGKSLFSTEMILKSFEFSSKTKCGKNPCPTNQWPWINENGKGICSQNKGNVPDCGGVIKEVLECQIPGTQFIIKDKENCGRRKIWSNFRQSCVRFYG